MSFSLAFLLLLIRFSVIQAMRNRIESAQPSILLQMQISPWRIMILYLTI